MSSCINATFLAVIPKLDCPNSFDDFCLIVLCNCLYKIIAKIIVFGLNPFYPMSLLHNSLDFLRVDLSMKQ
jgi:hypothetical protein